MFGFVNSLHTIQLLFCCMTLFTVYVFCYLIVVQYCFDSTLFYVTNAPGFVIWLLSGLFFFLVRMASVTSERGKQKFVDSGFMYVEDKRSVDGTKRFWRCERRNDGCKARLHTNAHTGQVYICSCLKILNLSYPVTLFISDTTTVHSQNARAQP